MFVLTVLQTHILLRTHTTYYVLTADGEVYWITGAIADRIGHTTLEWSLVIAGHTEYSESGASISELNSVTGCNLRAAVHPEERERGSRGGAGQMDRAAELRQVCVVGSYHHTGDWFCSLK